MTMDIENLDASVKVPAGSIKGASNIGVEVMVNAGMNDGASDVVMVWKDGPLNVQPVSQLVQAQAGANPTRGTERQRRDHGGDSGLWIWVDMAPTTEQIDIYLKSPNSSLLSHSAMEMMAWPIEQRVVCIDLMWDGGASSLGRNFTHTPWDDVKHEWPLPLSQRSAVNGALTSNNLWVKVQFATAQDNEETGCTGDWYQANSVMDPSSGQPIEITIPTAAALSYGPVYRWPATPRNTACMQSGNCDLATADRTEYEADCSGDACTVQCSTNCDGFFQVSSKSQTPLIIGVTVAVIVVAAMFVGSALYFRRNPEKWEDVKGWGPRKYVSLKRSMQTRI
jgi:hypothetical protein